jgi:hypothetical protein
MQILLLNSYPLAFSNNNRVKKLLNNIINQPKSLFLQPVAITDVKLELDAILN